MNKNTNKVTDNSKYAYDTSKRVKHPIDFGISIPEVQKIINEWIIKDKYKEIAELRYCEGKIFEDIADLMQMSTTSVKKIAYHCGDIIETHIHSK